MPIWYTFIKEDIPALCPVSHIVAKVLAEGVIDALGYQMRAELFFSTKLNLQVWTVRWLRGEELRQGI